MNINPLNSEFKPEYHIVKFGKSIFKGTKQEVIKFYNKLDRNVKCFCWKAETSQYSIGFRPMITKSMIKSTLKSAK